MNTTLILAWAIVIAIGALWLNGEGRKWRASKATDLNTEGN